MQTILDLQSQVDRMRIAGVSHCIVNLLVHF